MKPKTKTRIKNALRWFAVLPACILSGGITFQLLYFITDILGVSYGYIPIGGCFADVWPTIIVNLVTSVVVLGTASAIAPEEGNIEILGKVFLLMTIIEVLFMLDEAGLLLEYILDWILGIALCIVLILL